MDKRTRRQLNQARSYAAAIHDVIHDVFESGNPADRILSSGFRRSRKYGSRDRRMISDTLFSVLRWWGWLEHLTKIPDRLLRDKEGGSRTDWYAILFGAHMLDNDKFHPVALQWKSLAGLTDYVDAAGALSLEEKAVSFHDCFGRKQPNWIEIVPHWLRNEVPLPKEGYYRLVETMQQRPPMWIRVQTRKRQALLNELRNNQIDYTESPYLPNAISLGQPRINLYNNESFRSGRFEVQDFASQVIGYLTGAKPGQRWWDACAGAGGKSLQLACMMQNKGTVLATDIREYKLTDLKKRARRAGFSNIMPKAWDGKGVPAKDASFDGVLVDAPCTCTGTWRRNPDARWTTRAEEVAEIAELQLDILNRAAAGVKPGGALVYATCSLCERENEGVVTGFLATHAEFALSPLKHPVTGEETPGMLRVWPYQADCDATFVARFIRSENVSDDQ